MAFDKGRRPGIPLAIGVGATGPIGIVSGKGTSEFVVGGMGRLEFGFLQTQNVDGVILNQGLQAGRVLFEQRPQSTHVPRCDPEGYAWLWTVRVKSGGWVGG